MPVGSGRLYSRSAIPALSGSDEAAPALLKGSESSPYVREKAARTHHPLWMAARHSA